MAKIHRQPTASTRAPPISGHTQRRGRRRGAMQTPRSPVSAPRRRPENVGQHGQARPEDHRGADTLCTARDDEHHVTRRGPWRWRRRRRTARDPRGRCASTGAVGDRPDGQKERGEREHVGVDYPLRGGQRGVASSDRMAGSATLTM